MEKRSFQELSHNSNGVTYVSSDGFSNENKNALKSQAQENPEDQQTFKKSNFIRNVRGNVRQKGKIQ